MTKHEIQSATESELLDRIALISYSTWFAILECQPDGEITAIRAELNARELQRRKQEQCRMT